MIRSLKNGGPINLRHGQPKVLSIIKERRIDPVKPRVLYDSLYSPVWHASPYRVARQLREVENTITRHNRPAHRRQVRPRLDVICQRRFVERGIV